MTKYDQVKIKSEIINALQNEWGIDNRDSDSFDEWLVYLCFREIQELERGLVEKVLELVGEYDGFTFKRTREKIKALLSSNQP